MSSYSNTDYSFEPKQALIGGQMMFVAFGGLVLVPLLTGLDPNVALFTAGLGTLLFQLVTRGQVPVFLASSFAFIAPISVGVANWGIPGTLCGLVAAGIVYILLSAVIRLRGDAFLKKYLPPIVTGPVVMVIGLVLAPVAINMAAGKTGDGAVQLVPLAPAVTVALIALTTTIIVTLFGRGLFRVIPVLAGVVAGYVAALIIGAVTGTTLVDFAPVAAAPVFAIPSFVFPEWNWHAIIFLVPVAIAPAIEHFGDIIAIRAVTKKDYLENPGIKNTMLGDGLATSLAGFLGGPPNTTYSEVTGAVALTRAFNPAIMTWAAIWAIALSFIGTIGAILQTIPVPVMGGILILLFGTITVVGLASLLRAGESLMDPRNLMIVAIILVVGIGGATVPIGGLSFGGIGLAGILGVILNIIIPERFGWQSGQDDNAPA